MYDWVIADVLDIPLTYHLAIRIVLQYTGLLKSYNSLSYVYHPAKVNPYLVGSAGFVALLPSTTVCIFTLLPPFTLNITAYFLILVVVVVVVEGFVIFLVVVTWLLFFVVGCVVFLVVVVLVVVVVVVVFLVCDVVLPHSS